MSDQELIEFRLATILQKLEGIENCLYGHDDRPGIRIEVDRLNQARASHGAVLWVLFSTVLGAAAAVTAQLLGFKL